MISSLVGFVAFQQTSSVACLTINCKRESDCTLKVMQNRTAIKNSTQQEEVVI